MPAASSIEAQRPPSTQTTSTSLSRSVQLAMVLLGYVPLLHVGMTIGASVLGAREWGLPGSLIGLAFLYLLPPLASRSVFAGRRVTTGPRYAGSPGFLPWWFSLQCQMVFARMPILEEVVRLVPGAYSLWLRLWGARIGKLVYWCPRVLISDRPLLEIGDHVIIGGGAKLAAHYIGRDADGEMYLHIAPVRIGDRCVVGAHSMLPPSSDVPAGTVTPSSRMVVTHLTDRAPWERLPAKKGAPR